MTKHNLGFAVPVKYSELLFTSSMYQGTIIDTNDESII